MAYIMKRGSPLLPAFSAFIQGLFEGGTHLQDISITQPKYDTLIDFTQASSICGMNMLNMLSSHISDIIESPSPMMCRHSHWLTCKQLSIFYALDFFAVV